MTYKCAEIRSRVQFSLFSGDLRDAQKTNPPTNFFQSFMGLGQSKEDKVPVIGTKQTKGSADPNFGQGESETSNFVERNASKNAEEAPSNASSPARQPTKDAFNATTLIASRANFSQRALRSHYKRNVRQSAQRKSIKRRHVKATHRDERNGPKYST